MAPLYATKLDAEIPPRILESSKQEGCKGAEPPTTVLQSFESAVKRWGDRNALAVKRVPPVSQESRPQHLSHISTHHTLARA